MRSALIAGFEDRGEGEAVSEPGESREKRGIGLAEPIYPIKSNRVSLREGRSELKAPAAARAFLLGAAYDRALTIPA
jgi:hypothetical protein